MSTDIAPSPSSRSRFSVASFRSWCHPGRALPLLWALVATDHAASLFASWVTDDHGVVLSADTFNELFNFDLYFGVRLIDAWRLTIPLCCCLVLLDVRPRKWRWTDVLAGLGVCVAALEWILYFNRAKAGWFGYAPNADITYSPDSPIGDARIRAALVALSLLGVCVCVLRNRKTWPTYVLGFPIVVSIVSSVLVVFGQEWFLGRTTFELSESRPALIAGSIAYAITIALTVFTAVRGVQVRVISLISTGLTIVSLACLF